MANAFLTRLPTVSVVIPTYKRSWGLRRAVTSVLAQDFGDIELIIVDDASGDDTQSVALSFRDSRVRYYCQEQNVGVAKNWGKGVELARAEFVCILMDDDRVSAGYIARRVSVLQKYPRVVAVFSGYHAIDEHGNVKKVVESRLPPDRPVAGESSLSAMLTRDCFVGATMYRTSAVRKMWPLITNSRIVIDYALNVRLALQAGANVVYLPDPDFIMSFHPAQVSQTSPDAVFHLTQEFLSSLLCEKHPNWAVKLIRHEAAHWLIQHGRKFAMEGCVKDARKCFWRAAYLLPFSRHPWTQLVKAYGRRRIVGK